MSDRIIIFSNDNKKPSSGGSWFLWLIGILIFGSIARGINSANQQVNSKNNDAAYQQNNIRSFNVIVDRATIYFLSNGQYQPLDYFYKYGDVIHPKSVNNGYVCIDFTTPNGQNYNNCYVSLNDLK